MTCEVKDKFRFIHIPKTAGNSVFNWLRNSHENVIRSSSTEGRRSRGHETLSEALNFGTVDFTVSTTRNPYDRLVSMFFHINRRSDIYYTKNFNDWLLSLYKGQKFLLSHHFFRLGFNQSAYLDGPIDYLMRFESLEEDFKVVQNYFNNYTKLPFDNVGKRDKDYRIYYSADSKKIAYKLIEEDLDTFKYTF